MDKLKIIFVITLVIISNKLIAQSNQTSLMLGYKAIQISASYTAENELIFGGAISATSTSITEKRANNNDKGKQHNFKGDITPAVFGLIGGKFDDLSIIGKIGAAYVNQTINNVQTKDVFLALGISVDYKIYDNIGLIGSYDSVSGPMIGITLHFNEH